MLGIALSIPKMQINGSLVFILVTLIPVVHSQVYVNGLRCRLGGKIVEGSCAESDKNDIACGDHKVVSA